MNIGERIKNRRKELDLSVDDVANRLGKNRATIYRYESSDIENLPITILEPLAGILKTTPDYLMGWISEKELPNNEVAITEKEKELLSYYNQLNDLGKDEAIKRVSELTELPKYCNVFELSTKKENVKEDKNYLEPFAAHADLGEKLEIDQRDLDDMDNW